MTATIVVHSFTRDTGKTNITARLAALVAAEGARTGAVDADVSVPELHMRYRLDAGGMGPTFNDFLLGRSSLAEAAIDLGPQGGLTRPGVLVFAPASPNLADIRAVLHQRVDMTTLHDGFAALSARYDLDALFVNAPAGLDEISLSCIALADVLIVALRLDEEDTHGASVTLDLAQRLSVPQILLAVTRVPDAYDADAVRREVEAAYGYPAPLALTAADEAAMMFADGASALEPRPHVLTPLLRAIQTAGALR